MMRMEDIHQVRDYSQVRLKPDSAQRPVWICDDNHVFLEPTSKTIFEAATEFLIAIAEPVSRPRFVHEYVLTPFSLYAAASTGLSREIIMNKLDILAKNLVIPEEVKRTINTHTIQYGRAKMVLRNNKYYLETIDDRILQQLISIDEINREYHRALKGKEEEKEKPVLSQEKPTITAIQGNGNYVTYQYNPGDEMGEDEYLTEEEKKSIIGRQFEIKEEYVKKIKQECIKSGFPLLEEYEFKNEPKLLNLDLKPVAHIRPYQEQSLSKMLSSGRARSGIIVLPCGAGKTLVGISAICTIKRPTIVFCTSGVAVNQWASQIEKWAVVRGVKIVKFTSKSKDEMFTKGEAGILIATYSMMTYTGHRNFSTEMAIEKIKEIDWGLLIADEVQVVPATTFSTLMTIVHAHCKLGLTATLVREDNKIDDLNYLIGPKLFEANWQKLQNEGYLARVQCIEVLCSMTPEFYAAYLEVDGRKKEALYAGNPNKFIALQQLMHYHESKGHKIIVFSDNLFVLIQYSTMMKKPAIHGKVPDKKRTDLFSEFENKEGGNTLFLSKVGDTSIDLPSANVIIQISSHFGSRRQEAQRLGRILRPKEDTKEEYNAFFYSLISKHTKEMFHAHNRQQFLIDQGYAFKVLKEVPKIEGEKQLKGILLEDKESQKRLLDEIVKAGEDDLKEEEIADEDIINEKETDISGGHKIEKLAYP